MAKYEIRPEIVEATQWFKNGDHPEDYTETLVGNDGTFLSEGRVVRRYRTPDMDGQSKCEKCGDIMHAHGWIDNHNVLIGNYIVCPGDWVIISIRYTDGGRNLYYTVTNEEFNKCFKKVGVEQ